MYTSLLEKEFKNLQTLYSLLTLEAYLDNEITVTHTQLEKGMNPTILTL